MRGALWKMGQRGKPMVLSLGEIADHLGAVLYGQRTLPIQGMATLEHAGPGQISFLANRRYRRCLPTTRASAVILAPEDLPACPTAALVMHNPYLGCARALALLHPLPSRPRGIHPTAWVSPSAKVDASAWIGPQAVVEAGAAIEAGCFVGPACVIGENVVLKQSSRLVAHVTLCQGVQVGARALIHPGVVIGADGFGFANDQEVWVKVPQVGSVLIGNDVEIGANTCIDRGTLEDTVLEEGVKLDNQVQVGHNVHIGAHTAIAGCVGIAGSTRIGRHCMIGGAVNIGGHLEIPDGVHIAGASTVSNSLPGPGIYSSTMPVQESSLWRKTLARIHQIDNLARRLLALERGRLKSRQK
jgi:UDP-3-O-[3-hydroxymyristoyl] glucosamine N-acyltransferase